MTAQTAATGEWQAGDEFPWRAETPIRLTYHRHGEERDEAFLVTHVQAADAHRVFGGPGLCALTSLEDGTTYRLWQDGSLVAAGGYRFAAVSGEAAQP